MTYEAVEEVSILVLMDLAFEYKKWTVKTEEGTGFNPCFNGSCIRIILPMCFLHFLAEFQSLF